jgi:hypothetical protein
MSKLLFALVLFATPSFADEPIEGSLPLWTKAAEGVEYAATVEPATWVSVETGFALHESLAAKFAVTNLFDAGPGDVNYRYTSPIEGGVGGVEPRSVRFELETRF